MNRDHQGKLFIISGPSGAGKSTVLRQVLQSSTVPLQLSVSATTRARRPGEEDHVDYHFLSADEFRSKWENGDFLEAKEVFGQGYWYGTLWSEVTSGWKAGKTVILEIDVQGALAAVESIPDAVTIFLHPGSMAELERRLRDRGTESEESIQRRLSVAEREMQQLTKYQHEIMNDRVERAAEEICQILCQYSEQEDRSN